jgi:general stress protein 26
VSGTARISQDRERIRELWAPDWKAWFPEIDEKRDGSADDPRLALIFVDADSVTYQKNDKPKPVILFEVAKGIITGSEPDTGRVRELNMK